MQLLNDNNSYFWSKDMLSESHFSSQNEGGKETVNMFSIQIATKGSSLQPTRASFIASEALESITGKIFGGDFKKWKECWGNR